MNEGSLSNKCEQRPFRISIQNKSALVSFYGINKIAFFDFLYKYAIVKTEVPSMHREELLDKIAGTGLSPAKKKAALLDAERRLLEKLVADFSLDEGDQEKIVSALTAFRGVYARYLDLYMQGPPAPREAQGTLDFGRLFLTVQHTLKRDSRGCYTTNKFFGPIRYLFHACQRLNVPDRHKKTYLEWVLQFPVFPAGSMQEVCEHELYPAIFPEIYMFEMVGFLRSHLETLYGSRRLTGKDPHKRICGMMPKYRREMGRHMAEAIWFKSRLPGSAGSRQ